MMTRLLSLALCFCVGIATAGPKRKSRLPRSSTQSTAKKQTVRRITWQSEEDDASSFMFVEDTSAYQQYLESSKSRLRDQSETKLNEIRKYFTILQGKSATLPRIITLYKIMFFREYYKQLDEEIACCVEKGAGDRLAEKGPGDRLNAKIVEQTLSDAHRPCIIVAKEQGV